MDYFRRWTDENLREGNLLRATVEKIKGVFEEDDTDSSAMLCHSIVENEKSPMRLITNALCEVNKEKVA